MKERKIIVNKCDVSGCEFYCRYTDNCLDYKHWYDKPLCKNLPDCHYKQLKRKEQECEGLRKVIDEAKNSKLDLNSFFAIEATVGEYCLELDQLKAKLKSAKELREYTYDCCKQAGEELAKNSFEWDGKEKNLVVQAMELNERFDQLKVENEDLQKRFNGIYNFNKKILDQNYKLACREIHLKQTLAEIKEVLQFYNNSTIGKSKGNGIFEFEVCNESGKYIYCYDTNPAKQALQKISEVLE